MNSNRHSDAERRKFLRRSGLMTAAVVSEFAAPAFLNEVRAQEKFPDRPLKLIVPFPPGGPTDLFGRIIATRLGDVLGQQVIVENKPGAAGIIGSEFVARSKPDAYTLLFGTAATHAINATLYRKLSYHPLRDFEAIAFVGTVPAVLLAHPSMPSSLTELIKLLKENPGKFSYGSAGNGTTNHLAGEMLNAAAGIRVTHVPYKGSAPALQDVLGGNISYMFETFGVAMPHLQGGRLRALAVAAAKRSTAAPDVPTFSEAGLAGFDASTWNVVMAPAGTPKPLVDRLNSAVNEVLREPVVSERLVKLGIIAVEDSTPTSTAATISREIEKWAKAVEMSGAKAD